MSGVDLAALREALENLHSLARGHDYADAKELATGEDAIDDVLDEVEQLRAVVAGVEALVEEWDHEDVNDGPIGDRASELRAALTGGAA